MYIPYPLLDNLSSVLMVAFRRGCDLFRHGTAPDTIDNLFAPWQEFLHQLKFFYRRPMRERVVSFAEANIAWIRGNLMSPDVNGNALGPFAMKLAELDRQLHVTEMDTRAVREVVYDTIQEAQAWIESAPIEVQRKNQIMHDFHYRLSRINEALYDYDDNEALTIKGMKKITRVTEALGELFRTSWEPPNAKGLTVPDTEKVEDSQSQIEELKKKEEELKSESQDLIKQRRDVKKPDQGREYIDQYHNNMLLMDLIKLQKEDVKTMRDELESWQRMNESLESGNVTEALSNAQINADIKELSEELEKWANDRDFVAAQWDKARAIQWVGDDGNYLLAWQCATSEYDGLRAANAELERCADELEARVRQLEQRQRTCQNGMEKMLDKKTKELGSMKKVRKETKEQVAELHFQDADFDIDDGSAKAARLLASRKQRKAILDYAKAMQEELVESSNKMDEIRFQLQSRENIADILSASHTAQDEFQTELSEWARLNVQKQAVSNLFDALFPDFAEKGMSLTDKISRLRI